MGRASTPPREPRGSNVGTMHWREQGRCRGTDPEVFFPFDDEDAGEAKEICGRCRVRETCLEHAITHREKLGVWGGLTERERRRLIRRRRRSA